MFISNASICEIVELGFKNRFSEIDKKIRLNICNKEQFINEGAELGFC